MGQYLAPVYVRLVLHDHIFAQDCDALHSHPSPDGTRPADDTALQPGIRMDYDVSQNRTPLDANTYKKCELMNNAIKHLFMNVEIKIYCLYKFSLKTSIEEINF